MTGDAPRFALPFNKRHVGVDLWLSADMKFLLMVLGLKGATGKYSCIYCKADLKERQDWLQSARASRRRTATDPVDPTTGQHFKNLFMFIPRDQVVLDTLHLLLRCVDRLVHTVVLLFLELTGTSEAEPEKQLLHVNKALAPYIAKITKKARITFQ